MIRGAFAWSAVARHVARKGERGRSVIGYSLPRSVRRSAFSPICLILGCATADPGGPPGQNVSRQVAAHAPEAGAAHPNDSDADPEEAFRQFLAAMLASDERRVRETMVVHAGMEILWAGPPATPDVMATARTMPIRRVRVGETLRVPTPNGPWTLDVTANEVNDGRVLLMLPGDPVPHAVVKVGGRWRADGGEFVAARTAAPRK